MNTYQASIFDSIKPKEQKQGYLVRPDENRNPIRWQGWTDDHLTSEAYTVPHWETWEFDHDGITYFIQQVDNGWDCTLMAMDKIGMGWSNVPRDERPAIIEAFLAQKPEAPSY